MFDIDLLIGFLSGLVYGLTVFPIGFTAQECLDPVEGHIFEIFTEMQILFSG
jgi:hypothetical protein